jgi:hypothetical protein
MLTLFWNSQGPILEHCQEQGMMKNVARYIELLCNKSNSEQMLRTSQGVVLHDNACLHTAAQQP